MADYDVGVVGLSVPPAAAVKTTYRPAVLVRNNGLHDALASGYIRIYKAGLMVFESELYSPTIDPGENSLAQAVDYWTPDLGTYMVCGYVTCPLDQVEPNNNLAPVTVIVGGGPIPPTPPVTLHASQHEEGGADEVSLDGLPGRARDPQVPYDHVSNHKPGGSDELDVTGLSGQLRDPQPTAEHGNEKHTTPFATVLQVGDLISAHNAGITQHAAATNLEKTANKGAASGYAPLDSEALVPAENLPEVTPASHNTTHEDGGSDEISIAGLTGNPAARGSASGLASLDETTKVPTAELGTGNASATAFLRGDRSWEVPIAAAHHTSHEPGGSDTISGTLPGAHQLSHQAGQADALWVDGLQGVLATAQTPVPHHTRHEAGGDDPVAVVPGAHKATHENGGADELSIAGLSGQAADAQTPTSHKTSQDRKSVV